MPALTDELVLLGGDLEHLVTAVGADLAGRAETSEDTDGQMAWRRGGDDDAYARRLHAWIDNYGSSLELQ